MSKIKIIKRQSGPKVFLLLVFFIIGSQINSETYAFQVKKDTLDYWNVQKFVVNQKTSKEQLDEIKARLKKENVSIDFSNISRDENNGYIKGIKISYKSKKSNGEYAIEPNEPFNPIAIQYDVVGKTVDIGPNPTSNLSQTIQLEPKRIPIKREEDTLRINDNEASKNTDTNDKAVTRKSDTIITKYPKKMTSAETVDTLSLRAEPKDQNVYIDSESKVYVIKKVDGKVIFNDSLINRSRGNLKWSSDNGSEEDIIAIGNGNQIFFRDSKNKPLMVLDGEVYTDDLKFIDPNSINSLHVLKGDMATARYGEDGNNGVVEIYTKEKNTSGDYNFQVEKDESTTPKNGNTQGEEDSLEFMTLTLKKDANAAELEKQREYLKKINVEVEYSKIQRDEVDYITRIRITLKDKNGNSASSIFSDAYGIGEIYFGKDKKGLFISATR